MAAFAVAIDRSMQEQNIYYKDLLDGHILRPAVITDLPKDAFVKYARFQGTLGGQFKLPRLANDRKVANQLSHNPS